MDPAVRGWPTEICASQTRTLRKSKIDSSCRESAALLESRRLQSYSSRSLFVTPAKFGPTGKMRHHLVAAVTLDCFTRASTSPSSAASVCWG